MHDGVLEDIARRALSHYALRDGTITTKLEYLVIEVVNAIRVEVIPLLNLEQTERRYLMDNDALANNLRAVVKQLPDDVKGELVRTIRFVFDNMKRLEALAPLIKPLQPHFQTAMVEMAMGVLDKDGLENAFRGVLDEAGVTIPGPYSAT